MVMPKGSSEMHQKEQDLCLGALNIQFWVNLAISMVSEISCHYSKKQTLETKIHHLLIGLIQYECFLI